MALDAEFRVGLIGYGLAGAVFHAPLIAATPGMKLAVVVTANAERQQQVKRDHPGALVVDRVEELWSRAGELDLVVVATPNRSHVPLARAAIDSGLAVVVDKPFAVTAAEGRGLVDEARRRGIMLTVFQNRRWAGDFLTVRRLLKEGDLGEPLRFESRYERWRPVPVMRWREDPEQAGGLLYDLGSHVIDQALVLFGPIDEVYAELDRRRVGVEVDDDTFVALRHGSGVRSHLYTSVMAAQPGPSLRLLGSRAAYVKFGMDPQEEMLRSGMRPGDPGWGQEPAEKWGRVGAGESSRVVPTVPGAYQAFYEGVVLALRGQAPPPVDPSDAVSVLELIEAAFQSSAERRVVVMH